MIFLILFLSALFVAIAAGIMAGLSDIRGLTIPNNYSVIIMAAFGVAYLADAFAGQGDVLGSILSHALSGLIVFFLTAALFATRVMGAADSKLASVYALWTGLGGLPAFLFYTAIFGGVLGLSAIIIRKLKPFKKTRQGSWIERVQAGESKVPYGVAITAGALASFVKLGYLDFSTLGSFVIPVSG